ncbi:hypothetical protein ACT4ML_19635 [Natrinema sp. LN54]
MEFALETDTVQAVDEHTIVDVLVGNAMVYAQSVFYSIPNIITG